ncbi:hypothetical protein D8682_25670 [Buttiauxella sp. 3AFRM03]|jgi:hypothetical protein|uniref:hypothetical protein n=1 Tax=Buttiauxella sp. 3AFRM03 TaxID=2479367 RepID=UPI000EF7CA7A|nr:hypothetical protein [Buttiauxella sp. 3AFRM03]AYN30071.1 hypothetical protein D8682_25670 [Buttiauxella sp. 3AFRM03]
MVAYLHYLTPISINTKNLDIIDLAERCELLTDILIDSENPAECAALCNYVYAHIEAIKENLDKPLSAARIEQLSVDDPSEFPEAKWLADNDDLCDYCLAVARALLCRSLPLKTMQQLNGLLMRLVNALVDDLKTPRFLRTANVA